MNNSTGDEDHGEMTVSKGDELQESSRDPDALREEGLLGE